MLVASGFRILEFSDGKAGILYAKGWILSNKFLGGELDTDEVHVLNFR